MAGAVETVAADVVLAGHLGIQRVVRSCFGQGGEEGGIEDRHVGNVRQQGLGVFDAINVGRVVQRGQWNQRLEAVQHVAFDQLGGVEFLAAVHHAVAHRAQV